MPCANHGCVFVERLLACQEGICPEELYCGPAVRFLLPKLASLSQTLATHRSQCNRWIRNTDMMTSSFEGIIIIIIIFTIIIILIIVVIIITVHKGPIKCSLFSEHVDINAAITHVSIRQILNTNSTIHL
jgi:hypothetical protein